MISQERLRLREHLRVLQERKKMLDEINLENEVDISNDKCYIILVAQISLLKKLIREFEDGERPHGIFSGRSRS